MEEPGVEGTQDREAHARATRYAQAKRMMVLEGVFVSRAEEAVYAAIDRHVLGKEADDQERAVGPHDCLPFPAGPVVPRYWTRVPPALAPITTGQRCMLAAALLLGDRDAVSERGTTAQSALTGLVRLSFREWIDRHPELVSEDGAAVSNAMLLTIVRTATANSRELRKDDFRDVMHYRENFARAGRYERSQLRKGKLSDPPAFGKSALACECDECSASHSGSAARDTEVERVLNEPYGQWRLLSGFFLNQLHSLLAWGGDSYGARNSGKEERSTLHSSVLSILSFIALGEGVGSLEAIGLLSVLPRLEGYGEHAGDGVAAVSDVPYCFVPGAIGDTKEALSDALRYLANQVDAWSIAPRVAALAQEVAAVLTDPAFVRHADMTEDVCRQYVHHYDHLRSARGGFEASAGLRWLLPRNTRLRAYFNWMRERGLGMTLASQLDQNPPREPLLSVGVHAPGGHRE